MNKKKLLCTGCSGFVGHHLIPEAQKGKWFVVGVDKRPIVAGHSIPDHFIQTKVEDLGYRDLCGVEAVVHLAFATNIPNSVRHPVETTKQNISMTVKLLEVCKEAGVKRLIFPSTASLYANNKTPWTEDMVPEPIEPYSWQKLACEHLCQLYAKNGLETVILRFFQVFGEFQREDTALAAFIKSKEEGRSITLTKTVAQSAFKSGQRDFVYAGDVARAIMLAIKSKNVGSGDILNIASGEYRAMDQIAETLKAKIEWIPRRNWEVERHHGDIKKARTLLGWNPEVDVIEWLQKSKF